MDDLTVLVHTSTPQYDMLHVLSTPRTGWVMSQRQVNELGEEEASLRGVGTGPWEIVEAKTGEFWKFEAVDGHWRKTPNFAELIFWEIPEKSTRVANFQVGRLDAMNMNLESLPSIQRVAGVKFMRVEAGSSVHLGIYGNWYVGVGTPEQRPGYDPDLPWVSGDPDPRSVEWRVAVKVRQALALSIDHEAIVDALLEDEGKPLGLWGWQANEHRLPPDIRQWPYDPDKAKQLLAEAGYPNGFEIILAPALIGSPGEEACEFVAEMWGGGIGLGVEFQLMPYSALRPQIFERTYNQAICQGGTGGVDPLSLMNVVWHSAAGFTGGADHPLLDEMLNEATTVMDVEKRYAVLVEIAAFLFENALDVGLYSVNTLWPLGPRLGDWRAHLEHGDKGALSGLEYAPHR